MLLLIFMAYTLNVPTKSPTGETIYQSGTNSALSSQGISIPPPPKAYFSMQDKKTGKYGEVQELTSIQSGSEPITSQSLSSQQSISIPSAGGATSIGGSGAGITGGADAYGAFASAISGLQATADETKKSGEVKKDPNQLDSGGLADLVKQLHSQTTPVNSAEIYAQQEQAAGLQQKQQLVNDYTAQLNAITAKAQAQQLMVTGQGRGIPEAIIGGQQAQIAKEAAIQALPIAAQLSAAQGNLQMAQQHVDTYSKLLISDAQNKYDRQIAVINAVIPFATASEQRRLQLLDNKASQANATAKDNLERADSYAKLALGNGNQAAFAGITKLMANPTSSTFMQDVSAYAGQISPASTGGYTSKQVTAINKINENVSKNATYSKTSSMRNYGDNVLASLSLGTGVGDISAINQFQKVIDEGAVTRDQDVKLIQGSQSLANTLKTKIARLEKGEQLSPTLRAEMRTAVEAMYEKQVEALLKDPYIAAKNREAELGGITIDDTILGELSSFSKEGTVAPEDTAIADEAKAAGVVIENGGGLMTWFGNLFR